MKTGPGMLASVLEIFEDGVMIINRKGTVLYCNGALLRRLDTRSEEVIGRSIYDFMPSEAVLRRRRFLKRVAQARKPLHFQDEQEGHWFEHRVYPMVGGNGSVSSFVIYTNDITSQKRAEDRLRAEEALLHEVLNALPVGVRVLDENGELIRENPAARRIWRVEEAARTDREKDRGLIEALRQYDTITRRALKGKATIGQEIHFGSDIVQNRTVIQSGLPLSVKGKGIAGAVAVTEDISEIRQGGELLQIQRDLTARLSAISSTEQVLTFCLDVALRISGMECGGVYVVDPETGGLSLAVHRNLPDSFVSAVSHYDRKSLNARVVAAGKPVYSSFQEMKLEIPPGSDMVSLIVVPISHNGKTVACLNLGSRAPELPDPRIRVAIETAAAQIGGALVRMRSEEERLRLAEVSASHELFRTLANSAPVGIFLADGQGKCVYVNDRWCQMAGITRDQAMGGGWRAAVHPDDRERLIAEWEAATRKARKFDTEHRFLDSSGRIVWSAVSGVPVRDRKGRIVGYVGTVTDITELKRAEEESINLSRHLQAAREEERRKMSREIHDELGQALTAAKMELGLLSTVLCNQPDRFNEKVKSIRGLIDVSIQTVKRVSTGLRPLVLDELGLCPAIEWQAGEFQRRTGIVCEVDIEPDYPKFDQEISTALFRIMQEALTNVVRHAGAKRVSVRLRVEGEGVVLKVEDNGKGIGREKVHSPHSFGLIGMRERARAYGGAVEITGSPKRGTTLLVTIPIGEKKERS